MRKTAKSSRAPLAPLHNNSLRGESSRKAANENDKHTAKSFGRKATNKLHIAPPTKADKPVGSFPEARSSGSKTTKPQTPTKARKSVQLVTTSAVPARSGTLARIKQGPNKPAGAHVAKQAAKSIPSTVLQLDGPPGGKRVARQSAAPQSTKPGTFAPAVASQVGAGTLGAGSLQTDASPPLSVLSNWQVPATPPSISALLGTPEASLGAINIGTDLQYFPTHATPESAVKGVGTPQDFSDVFDLDEEPTSEGAASFAGCWDRTPGLILSTPQSNERGNQSLNNSLSATRCPSPNPRRWQPLQAAAATGSAGRQTLATPQAVEILKELRIKTPPLGSSSATTRLRSSPFLAQLLRTAPSLSPATSLLSTPHASPPPQPVPATAGQAGSAVQSLPDDIACASPTMQGSLQSLAASSPAPLPTQAAASASMESAASNSPNGSGLCQAVALETGCVTPVLSESAAESAIRQALVRLASSEKVIRLMSPVDLDAPHCANPHAPFAVAAGSLPKFTLAALDSPPAAAAGITRQSSGSVNGPEAAATCASSPATHPRVVPIQEVVDQLLSCPKLAVTGPDTAQDDKTPYQTLLQHLMGSGQAAALSPGAPPSCPKPAAKLASVPALFSARIGPVLHPVIQATPARHRLAQTTYKTPSTVQDPSSPSQASFCFPSPITDQSSPLATFLHQLSHATYDSQDSPAESALPGAQAQCHGPPDACQGPTPFQDFMGYLTQATYHSPGSKAERHPAGVPGRVHSIPEDDDSIAVLPKNLSAAGAGQSPVRLGAQGLAAWLHCSQVGHAIRTPARNQLQEVWRQAGEAKHLSQLLEESSKVGEENAGLRQQLTDIQAALHQLTQTNQSSLQDAQAQRAAAAAEREKAKRTAQQLLALAHQTSKVTESYEAERHALRQDVARAKSQLAEAQAANLAAQAAAHTSTESSAAIEQAFLTAREDLQAAEEAVQAQSHKLTAVLQEKTELEARLQHSCHQLAGLQAAADAAGQQKDVELQHLAAQLKEAHEVLYEVQHDQQQAHLRLAADLAQQEEENARLRDAIAVAQQQLHGLAAAAERRALAEAVLAEEGEQQAHLLVAAQAMQRVREEENASLVKQLQEAKSQLQATHVTEQQPISLQIVVLDDSSSTVATTLTPAKAHLHPQQHAASAMGSAIDASQARADAQSDACSDGLGALCTPNPVCATPEARAAAAQLLRGFSTTQGRSLESGFNLEPEWPACPPPSLAGSPLMAPTPGPRTLALQADLVRTLNMGTAFASLDSELSSCSLELVNESPEQPRAPLPTPAGTPPLHRLAASTLSLDAHDIANAFSLAHEQLRTSPVTQHRQCRPAITPLAFALPQAHPAATAGAAAAADEESPVVKTTRQVSSVLAAVAELEAAQGITGKRVAQHSACPASKDTNKLLTPVEASTTPAHRFSTRFIQSPAATQAVPTQTKSMAEPGVSNVANPLFSPVAASLDPMLTPFYTPASMSSIRTGCDTPTAAVANGGKASLAGIGGKSPAAVATPGSMVSTPGSGVVTGDWRSVTDRLQALRAQLQSAQKKLKATSEDKQKGSASLAGTPLADMTPRQQQLTPLGPHSLPKQPSSRAAAGASALGSPAVTGQENVEEQCLSAGRWLRGLAEECLENVYTPARLQSADAADDIQEDDHETLRSSELAPELWDAAYIRTRGLVSHPIVPTSPSTWDQSSVTSSPALSVHSPVDRTVPARVSPLDRLLARCKRAL